MKFRIPLLTCCILLNVIVGKVNNQNAFSAVTAFDGLVNLYLRMTIREPHIEPDHRIDADTKSSVCQSITKSGFFAHRTAFPIDMDTIFGELSSRAQEEETDAFLQRVVHDYEEKGIWRMMYTYRTRLTSVEAGSEIEEEFGFACAVRAREDNENRIEVYLISDAYNVNTAIDHPTEGTIEARFVFHCVPWGCTLSAVAEEPAKAFAGVDYSVEEIYLRMRKFYDVEQTEAEDSVCGLTTEEKLRVCTAVMNSSYFVGKLSFPPEQSRVSGKCQLTEVSLQTNEAMWEARGASYKEWMMSCAVVRIASDARDTYYVSRAYHSHYAIIYSQAPGTENRYIENISANISVVVERQMKIRVESIGQPPPNLAQQLRIIDEL